jgi:hemolysin activation/secretion protein
LGFKQRSLYRNRAPYWRSELQWPVFEPGQTLYAGIDYRRVSGPNRLNRPNAAFLAGTQLMGAVVDIRDGIPTRFVGASYNLFAGAPIYKRPGFPTSRLTMGLQVTTTF